MSLLLVSLLLASPPAAAEPAPFALFVQLSRSHETAAVWRVHADGRAERLPGDFPGITGWSLWEGTTYPVPSPDLRRLAFLGDGQIRVRDLASGEERAVTALDDPKSRFRLSITAWAPDSQALLYHLRAPIPEKSGDGCGGPTDTGTPVEYRVQDLKTGADRRVSVPDRHAILEWLPDGSFLLESLVFPHTWGTSNEGATSMRPLTKMAGYFAQFASDGADRVMALWWEADMRASRIGSIRLSDGSFEPISPLCSWGECSWGSFSPSGRRAAYIQACPPGEPNPQHRHLIVEGSPVYRCAEMWPGYVWIGDDAIALRCADELIVMGVPDGAVRSRTALPQ